MHILITKRTPAAPWRCRNACVVHAGLVSLGVAPGARAMQLRWLTSDRTWRFWWLRSRANPKPRKCDMASAWGERHRRRAPDFTDYCLRIIPASPRQAAKPQVGTTTAAGNSTIKATRNSPPPPIPHKDRAKARYATSRAPHLSLIPICPPPPPPLSSSRPKPPNREWGGRAGCRRGTQGKSLIITLFQPATTPPGPLPASEGGACTAVGGEAGLTSTTIVRRCLPPPLAPALLTLDYV